MVVVHLEASRIFQRWFILVQITIKWKLYSNSSLSLTQNMPSGITNYVIPDFNPGLKRVHLPSSAAGTIHLTGWVCGRRGLCGLFRPSNPSDPASRLSVPTALAAVQTYPDPGLKSGVTTSMIRKRIFNKSLPQMTQIQFGGFYKILLETDDESNGYEPEKESHQQKTATFYWSQLREFCIFSAGWFS